MLCNRSGQILRAALLSSVSFAALAVISPQAALAQETALPGITVEGANADEAPTAVAPADGTAADPLAPPATGTIGSPPPAFPGGQVATGQQLGLFGNRTRL